MVLTHASVLFILPLIIGNICSQCIKSQNEFTHEEQEDLKAMLRRLESRLNALAEREAGQRQ